MASGRDLFISFLYADIMMMRSIAIDQLVALCMMINIVSCPAEPSILSWLATLSKACQSRLVRPTTIFI